MANQVRPILDPGKALVTPRVSPGILDEPSAMGAALVVPADDGQEVRVRAEDREIAVYLVKYVIAHASKRIRNDQPCRDRTVLAEGVLDLLGGYHLRPVALDHRGRNEAVHGRRWNWTRVGLYGRVR